eukprot:1430417-Rhodomonas_salina.1
MAKGPCRTMTFHSMPRSWVGGERKRGGKERERGRYSDTARYREGGGKARKEGGRQGRREAWRRRKGGGRRAVSYTHLTLPTIC